MACAVRDTIKGKRARSSEEMKECEFYEEDKKNKIKKER